MAMNIDTKKSNALRAFRKFGFEVIREAEHIKMRNSEGVSISVPNHKRIKGSTLSQICRIGGIDKAEFFKAAR